MNEIEGFLKKLELIFTNAREMTSCFFCGKSCDSATVLAVQMNHRQVADRKSGVLLMIPSCPSCDEISQKDVSKAAIHTISTCFKIMGPCDCGETEEDHKAVRENAH